MSFAGCINTVCVPLCAHSGVSVLLSLPSDTAPPDSLVSPVQSQAVKDCMKRVKDTCQDVSTEHKDIHAAISKFGRAIDKVQNRAVCVCVCVGGGGGGAALVLW